MLRILFTWSEFDLKILKILPLVVFWLINFNINSAIFIWIGEALKSEILDSQFFGASVDVGRIYTLQARGSPNPLKSFSLEQEKTVGFSKLLDEVFPRQKSGDWISLASFTLILALPGILSYFIVS